MKLNGPLLICRHACASACIRACMHGVRMLSQSVCVHVCVCVCARTRACAFAGHTSTVPCAMWARSVKRQGNCFLLILLLVFNFFPATFPHGNMSVSHFLSFSC